MLLVFWEATVVSLAAAFLDLPDFAAVFSLFAVFFSAVFSSPLAVAYHLGSTVLLLPYFCLQSTDP